MMWSFKIFIRVFMLATIGISTINAYDVICQFDTSVYPPACQSFNLSPITSPNDLANIVGQSPSYVDYTPHYFSFTNPPPLNFIPSDLFNYLRNYEGFYANNAGITQLHSNAFPHCEKLTNMDLSSNTFTNIPADFAVGCYRMNFLQIYQGQVRTIDENAFRGLVSLQYLNMQYNQIECLPPRLFQDTRGLNQIDFSYNQIKALHPVLFKPLIQIHNINIMFNQISYIPDFDFDLGSLYGNSFSFYLYDNPIIAIHPLFLTHLFYDENQNMVNQQFQITFGPQSSGYQTCVNPNNPYPVDLFNIYGYYNWYQQNVSFTYDTPCYSNFSPQMADNSLITCGSAITTSTTVSTTTKGGSGGSGDNGGPCPNDKIVRCYLDYLDRYSCVVKGVEGSLSSITVGQHYSTPDYTYTDNDVERFYFMESQLGRVPSILFTKFPNLNYLYIRSTSLGVINDHTFNECGNLKFLDASYNEIIHIDESSLRNCTKLEVIDLTGNPLDYLSTQLYVYDPTVRNIHFHRNPDFVLA